MFACESQTQMCVCVLEEHPQKTGGGHGGDGGNEGQRERGGEIKEVTGEMVDGREGAGWGGEGEPGGDQG